MMNFMKYNFAINFILLIKIIFYGEGRGTLKKKAREFDSNAQNRSMWHRINPIFNTGICSSLRHRVFHIIAQSRY